MTTPITALANHPSLNDVEGEKGSSFVLFLIHCAFSTHADWFVVMIADTRFHIFVSNRPALASIVKQISADMHYQLG